MIIEQIHWDTDVTPRSGVPNISDASLVYIFGSPTQLQNSRKLDCIREHYPNAVYTGCSTAGEIRGDQVLDDSLVSTAVKFRTTAVKIYFARIGSEDQSYAAGKELAFQVSPENLKHLFILSDGIYVNGSELVRGIMENLPVQVPVTGGLAADADRFQSTCVLGPNGAEEKLVSAVAFYGDDFQISHGSMGGWDPFGPERKVTKARGNVVYELDGKPVLQLYKNYLGEHAAHLPTSALLFPLSVRASAADDYLIRTVVGIDEGEQSMRFACDIPENSRVRLLKANFERLIDGAIAAAAYALDDKSETQSLAVLISCVGRKLVLKQRISEEVAAVGGVLGASATLGGFYSYGEIAPINGFSKSDLHNQTMTVTRYYEK